MANGRPLTEIDWTQFDKLCELHCTLEEIAGMFACSADTIERAVQREKKMGFADYFAQKASSGRMSLRRKQFQIAKKGNVSMLIWLGKQWLGQKDKASHELSGPDGKPIETRGMSDADLDAKIATIMAKAGKK